MAAQIQTPSESDIIADPAFRIITTLKHTLFNENDLQHPKPQDAETIRQHRQLNSELLRLHKQRLHDAAQACSWTEVVARRFKAADTPHEAGSELDLEAEVEKALRTPQESIITLPERGFIRDMRVRVLIDRHGGIEVEHAAMGEARPLSTLAASLISLFPYSLPPPPPSLSPLDTKNAQGGCKVTLDTQATPATLFTTHKTTHRAPYTTSRSRATPPLSATAPPPMQREVILHDPAGHVTEASFSAVYFFRGGVWVAPREGEGMRSVTRTWALQRGLCVEGIVRVDEVHDGEAVYLSNAVRGFFSGTICT